MVPAVPRLSTGGGPQGCHEPMDTSASTLAQHWGLAPPQLLCPAPATVLAMPGPARPGWRREHGDLDGSCEAAGVRAPSAAVTADDSRCRCPGASGPTSPTASLRQSWGCPTAAHRVLSVATIPALPDGCSHTPVSRATPHPPAPLSPPAKLCHSGHTPGSGCLSRDPHPVPGSAPTPRCPGRPGHSRAPTPAPWVSSSEGSRIPSSSGHRVVMVAGGRHGQGWVWAAARAQQQPAQHHN